MEWVNTNNTIPIKSWCKDVEDGAMEQANNLANLQFAFRHVALMPDCHQGYGMPIGGVLATNGVVIPNAVGVDIGCGMTAVALDYEGDVSQECIKSILGETREIIPVGFNHHKVDQAWAGWEDAPINIPVIERELNKAKKQLGTLGGGNHFIEIQRGTSGVIWLMIHSGSRNFGFQVAKEYHSIAKQLCERWYSDIPHSDLSFLPMDSEYGKDYITAMNFALKFAKANRQQMMMFFSDIVIQKLDCDITHEPYDVHHNYAQMEHHFSKNVMVHRKGAIQAKDGLIGIIPGSQGTKSYIINGKNNPESFDSCSHGAGRKMGRKEAKRTLSLDEQKSILGNIVHSVRNVEDLDEAPGAYKDIDLVMSQQEDLVSIKEILTPLGVMKG